MSRNQQLLVGGVVFVGLLLTIGFWLNRGYGEVSAETYAYSKSLYSACLNKSADHLTKVEEMLSNDETLPKHELDWLMAIVTKARSGSWQSASKDARRMMEDQVAY